VTDRPLIVFDIGSTLVTGPAQGPARRIAARAGLDASQKAALHQALMTTDFTGPAQVAAFIRDEFGIAGPGVETAVEQVWTAQLDEAVPIPGSAEVLTALAEADFQLAVLSNIWPPFLDAARRHFGWFIDDLVPHDRRIFSFRAGIKKPAPEMFLGLLRTAGVSSDRAVMVGDSYRHDIAPAAAVGMRTVWLLHEPVREAANVVDVLNHGASGPSLALGSISDLTVTTAEALFAGRAGAAASAAMKEKA
jgi:HAD superfamily hydrolase (TIGR01509 family)